jgi:hypothetical protein
MKFGRVHGIYDQFLSETGAVSVGVLIRLDRRIDSQVIVEFLPQAKAELTAWRTTNRTPRIGSKVLLGDDTPRGKKAPDLKSLDYGAICGVARVEELQD